MDCKDKDKDMPENNTTDKTQTSNTEKDKDVFSIKSYKFEMEEDLYNC